MASVGGTMTSMVSTLAREAMRAPMVSVGPSATLRTVAALMCAQRVHCVVVDGIEGEHLVWGVISDRDLIRAATASDDALTAGSIAATAAVTVDAEDDLAEVGRVLAA